MKKTIIVLGILCGLTANAQNWSLTGNSGTTPGTNFLGTTDNQSLVFKTNNIEWMKLTPKGRLIFQNIDNGYGWDNNLFIAGGNDFATGLGNTGLGLGSLVSVTTGGANTAVGANALKPNTTGGGNTAVGVNSMLNNTIGNNNTSVGLNSLNGPGTLNENTAVGFAAMARYNAASTDAASYNSAFGFSALGSMINGNYNTALGRRALRGLLNGNNNIGIGENAASNLSNGNNNIIIGYETTTTGTGVNNQLNIGNWIRGNNGTIGIGTSNLPADGVAADGGIYKLFVKDGIKTEKVRVDVASANGWADYVFYDDYKLRDLKSLETYINENKHLPEVPSTEEAIKNGIELKQMNILLLKKIEELTLYLLQQNKQLIDQNQRIEDLEKSIKK
ncbi:hypothetical protein [Epilithonimonas sp. UC225_85]|uniref:hypothetical protein n=1 Tax=Epilithonimonas sp. UC225_85 TaxID=3350167 RepID=UPI0036D4126A